MGIDLTKLASQGRAYSAVRPWTEEELKALLLLERECNLSRVNAANYVRNGIMTVEDFEKSQEKDFKPKTLEDAQGDAEKSMKEHGKKALKKSGKKVGSKKK